jgi:tetratricopeptide (TPR) repeat protein
VVKEIEDSDFPLSPLQKDWLEMYRAELKGDIKKQYNLAKRAYEMDPAKNFFDFGWKALWINRPLEAIEAFKVANPKLGLFKDSYIYWNFYAYSYHLLGEHKNGLKIAQKARKFHPYRYDILSIEIRALATMGRIKDLERLFEESKKFPPQRNWNISRLLLNSGWSLRTHGFREESMDFFERAIQWLKGRPESETNTDDYRRQMAFLLFCIEKWEEAKTIYEGLAEENPDNLSYPCYLGLISAKLGNREDAQRISDELGKVERPYLFGRIPLYQACIASLLGDKEKALKLLRESVDQGQNFGPSSGFRFFVILESLADYPPFQEFMKPKG